MTTAIDEGAAVAACAWIITRRYRAIPKCLVNIGALTSCPTLPNAESLSVGASAHTIADWSECRLALGWMEAASGFEPLNGGFLDRERRVGTGSDWS
jgi:hypothetical protein